MTTPIIQLKLRRTQALPLTNDELDDNFAFISSHINSLYTITENINTDINLINDTLSSNADSLDDINNTLQSHNTRINTNTNDILDIVNQLSIHQGNISDNANNINLLSNTVTKLINRRIVNTDNLLTIGRTKEFNVAEDDIDAIIINVTKTIATTNTPQILTNKTLNGTDNTFVNIKASSITGIMSINNGGTNANTPEEARANLGLAIGSNVQAYNANTVYSDVLNYFTNVNIFNSSNLKIKSTNGNVITQIALGVAPNTESNSNTYSINFPNKSGTLATLDDVGGINALTINDIGVRVLAYNSDVVRTSIANTYLGTSKQTFGADNIRLVSSNSNIVNFSISGIGPTLDTISSGPSNTTLNFPVENGTLATREYIARLIGSDTTSNYSTDGYHTFANGFMIQWGVQLVHQTQQDCSLNPTNSTLHIHSRTYGSITFPIAFQHNCFAVIPVPRDYSPSYVDGCEMSIGIIKKLTTGFTYLINRVGGCTASGETSMYVDYVAIGY